MNRALRPLRSCLALLVAVSCTADRAPGNDTTTPEGSPPEEGAPRARGSAWNAAAGSLFAVHSTGTTAWLVNPAFGDTQALDTLTVAAWNAEGAELAMLDGAQVVGIGRVTGFRYDSTCAGWPTASLSATATPATPASWRVAFPDARVEGVAFDSLPALTPADSAVRARDGALAASRLPDDTIAAFRGRPFNVRQANRFSIGTDTLVTMYEVVRLVAQEANPLQEQILILTEEGASRPLEDVFHEREVGAEESMGSIELLAVLRLRSTGRVAILVRRERESGFLLEWIERSSRGKWVVRWRSAVDSC
jgi:hypothetical protein